MQSVNITFDPDAILTYIPPPLPFALHSTNDVDWSRVSERVELMFPYTPPPFDDAVHDVKIQEERVRSVLEVIVAYIAPPFSALHDVNVQGEEALVLNAYSQ